MVKGYNAQEVIKCSEWIEKCEAMEAQYNAVVAQNKSLQGELRLRQQMIDYLLTADILSTQNFSSENDFNSHFCKEYERIEQICIQELEAENGLH